MEFHGKIMNNKENKCNICGRLIGQFGNIEKEQCIFHCDKDEWFDVDENGKKDWSNSKSKILQFWEKIQEEIATNISIRFNKIMFPIGNGKEYIPFCNVIISGNKVKTIGFERCVFEDEIVITRLLSPIGIVFENCEFKNSIRIIGKINTLEFYTCSFFENLDLGIRECNQLDFINTTLAPKLLMFNTCTFNCIIYINNDSFVNSFKCDAVHFNNTVEIKNINIEKSIYIELCKFNHDLSIQNCTFLKEVSFKSSNFSNNSDVFINNNKINILTIMYIINDSAFFTISDVAVYSGLNLQEGSLSNFEIHNCNFERAKKTIKNIAFQGNNGFTIFNGVKWGDIRNTFDKTTDKDTFRQLKYVNEQQGNIIEANNFYSAEMMTYKEELCINTKPFEKMQDKIIFFMNDIISNFSQNWFLPLLWYFIFGFTFAFLYNSDFVIINRFSLPAFLFSIWSFAFFLIEYFKHNNIRISKILLLLSSSINYFVNVKNASWLQLIEFINPFNTSGLDDNPKRLIWWIIFRMLSVFVVYQFIISLRRQTRR